MIDRRDVGLAQVRAHRFARQQTDEALTLGVTGLRHAPGRSSRRLTVWSYLLAMVLLAGAGVLSLVRPAPAWPTAAVLIEARSGAVYVNRDGVLHPALNLTSALLATSEAADTVPMEVSADDIAGAARGPTLGIAGAPTRLPTADRLAPPVWSLCDRVDPAGGVVTTAVIGTDVPGVPLGAADAVLVDTAPAGSEGSPPSGTAVAQLFWATGRLAVDRRDLTLGRALGISDVTPRPVSPVWSAVLTAGPAPSVSVPAGSGQSSSGFVVRDASGVAVPVGSLLQVVRADGDITLYLLHRDGVETVSSTVADLLRHRTAARLVTVDPQQVALLPAAADHAVAAGSLPATVPRVLDATVAPTLCATWRGTPDAARIVVGTGPPPAAVPAPAGDGRVDGVQIAAGSGALVTRALPAVDVPTAGDPPQPLTYVDDLGVAYPITREAAVRLGLTTETAAIPVVPAALIDALTPGPSLDVGAAGRSWQFEPPVPDTPTGGSAGS